MVLLCKTLVGENWYLARTGRMPVNIGSMIYRSIGLFSCNNRSSTQHVFIRSLGSLSLFKHAEKKKTVNNVEIFQHTSQSHSVSRETLGLRIPVNNPADLA